MIPLLLIAGSADPFPLLSCRRRIDSEWSRETRRCTKWTKAPEGCSKPDTHIVESRVPSIEIKLQER